MSTQLHEYPEDIIFNFLKSVYTTYRTALDDPTTIPEETAIIWGSPPAEIVKPYTFEVVRTDLNRALKWLGAAPKAQYTALCVCRFGTLWIKGGKPPVLNEFEEFLDYELMTNIKGSYFTDRAISYITPGSSGISEPRDPNVDRWVLNYSVQVDYYKTFT